MESRTQHKGGKPTKRGVNGYIHVAKPATAAQILRDLGISPTQVKRLLQRLNFSVVRS